MEIDDSIAFQISIGTGTGTGDVAIYCGYTRNGDGRGDGNGYGWPAETHDLGTTHDGDGAGDGWYYTAYNDWPTSRGTGGLPHYAANVLEADGDGTGAGDL